MPTIDTDLLPLSENRERIESQTKAKVLVSDPRVIKICRDKVSTQTFLESNSFVVPRMYSEVDLEDGETNLSAFCEATGRSSSINAFRVNDPDELRVCLRSVKTRS